MAGGQLEPEEAKDLAGGIERRLNTLLADLTEEAAAQSAQNDAVRARVARARADRAELA
jgi:hypothetical protein